MVSNRMSEAGEYILLIVCAETLADPSPEPMCEDWEAYCTCVPRYLMEVTSQLDLDTTTSKEFAEFALTVYEDDEVVNVTASAMAVNRANGKTAANLILAQKKNRVAGKNDLA